MTGQRGGDGRRKKGRDGGGLFRSGRTGGPQAAFAVEVPLLPPALLRAIIGLAALVGLLLAVGFSAAKGAGQIVAPSIAASGEKKDPAVPAARQAQSRRSLGSDNGSQEQIKLQDPPQDPAGPVPPAPGAKLLLNLNCKKAKLSLKMLMVVMIPLVLLDGILRCPGK